MGKEYEDWGKEKEDWDLEEGWGKEVDDLEEDRHMEKEDQGKEDEDWYVESYFHDTFIMLFVQPLCSHSSIKLHLCSFNIISHLCFVYP